MRWLGELARHKADFDAHGCSINAVAADAIDKGRALRDRLGGALALFEDPGLAVSQAWGAGRPGDEEPTPATYVIGSDGSVLFEHRADPRGDWPDVKDVLAHLPAAR